MMSEYQGRGEEHLHIQFTLMQSDLLYMVMLSCSTAPAMLVLCMHGRIGSQGGPACTMLTKLTTRVHVDGASKGF